MFTVLCKIAYANRHPVAHCRICPALSCLDEVSESRDHLVVNEAYFNVACHCQQRSGLL